MAAHRVAIGIRAERCCAEDARKRVEGHRLQFGDSRYQCVSEMVRLSAENPPTERAAASAAHIHTSASPVARHVETERKVSTPVAPTHPVLTRHRMPDFRGTHVARARN